MKRLCSAILLILFSVFATACIGSTIQTNKDELRTRNGSCAADRLGPSYRDTVIKTCMRQGSPGTLYDEGEPLLITTVHGSTVRLGNSGLYQVTVKKDGENILQKVMDDNIPDTPTSSGGSWTSRDVLYFNDQFTEWEPGIYEITYTAVYNTNLTATLVITVN